MPTPLVLILSVQSIAILWLLLRARRSRRQLAALHPCFELCNELSRAAYVAVWELSPEEHKQKVPPEWRAEIEKMARDVAELGARFTALPPAEVLQSLQHEIAQRTR